MSFSSSQTILAVPPDDLANLAQVREDYGAPLPIRPAVEGGPEILTLLGHIDREGSSDLRAGQLAVSVAPIMLSDGRAAFIGHFSDAFLAALEIDPLMENCAILAEGEFAALRIVASGD